MTLHRTASACTPSLRRHAVHHLVRPWPTAINTPPPLPAALQRHAIIRHNPCSMCGILSPGAPECCDDVQLINSYPWLHASTCSPHRSVSAHPISTRRLSALNQLVHSPPVAMHQISLPHATVALHQLVCPTPPPHQLIRTPHTATAAVHQLICPFHATTQFISLYILQSLMRISLYLLPPATNAA